MIKINLLKSTSRTRLMRVVPPSRRAQKAPGLTREKAQKPFPAWKILRLIIVLLLIAACGGGAWLGWKLWLKKAVHQPHKKIVAAPHSQKPAEPATSQVPESDFVPSTRVTPSMVEDVVTDTDAPDPRISSGILHLAYSDLSTSEKINYETVFAKNILQYLADAVPESVGFTSLVIDSFSIIKATGAAPSREVVTRLFNALRSDRLELRGAPYSSIRPNGNRGFTFVFCCDASFGVNPAEPYQTADHLEPHENLPAMLDRFKRLAADNKIVLKKGLQEVSIEASSGFRRHHYTLSAGGTYRNVVKFVLQADKAHLPCAFRTLRLKARSRAVVDIDANLIFTTGN